MPGGGIGFGRGLDFEVVIQRRQNVDLTLRGAYEKALSVDVHQMHSGSGAERSAFFDNQRAGAKAKRFSGSGPEELQRDNGQIRKRQHQRETRKKTQPRAQTGKRTLES